MEKKFLLILGLFSLGIFLSLASISYAAIDIYDLGILQYKNLANISQPETWSTLVQCRLRAPVLTIAKWQKRERGGDTFTQGLIYVVAGDSVTYQFVVTNTGEDTGFDIVLTDTRTFEDAGTQGESLAYIASTVAPDTGGAVQPGYNGKVTSLEYKDISDQWVATTSATIPATAGEVKGIRWTIDYLAPTSEAAINTFTFKVSFPQ